MSTDGAGLAVVLDSLARYGTVECAQPDPASSHSMLAYLKLDERILVRSHGKGLGAARVYSAIYELLEHAVCMGPIVNSINCRWQLRDDLYGAGRYARDAIAVDILKRGESHILAHQFYRLRHGSGTDEPEIWMPVEDSRQASIPEPGSPRSWLHHYFENTTGWAAGATAEQALLHALEEVVERDAISALLIESALSIDRTTPIKLRPGSTLDVLMHDIELYSGDQIFLRLAPTIAGYCVIASSERVDPFDRSVFGSSVSTNVERACEKAHLEYEQEVVANESALTYEDDSPIIEKNILDSYPFLKAAVRLNLFRAPAQGDPLICGQPNTLHVSVQSALASMNKELQRGGFPVLYRTAWSPEFPDTACRADEPAVIQVLVPGAERFHLVRHGVPAEPIGRLRTDEVVANCRNRRWD